VAALVEEVVIWGFQALWLHLYLAILLLLLEVDLLERVASPVAWQVSFRKGMLQEAGGHLVVVADLEASSFGQGTHLAGLLAARGGSYHEADPSRAPCWEEQPPALVVPCQEVIQEEGAFPVPTPGAMQEQAQLLLNQEAGPEEVRAPVHRSLGLLEESLVVAGDPPEKEAGLACLEEDRQGALAEADDLRERC
ncbi:unnamed protein product, partial [Symbiodinium sp. KB8]